MFHKFLNGYRLIKMKKFYLLVKSNKISNELVCIIRVKNNAVSKFSNKTFFDVIYLLLFKDLKLAAALKEIKQLSHLKLNTKYPETLSPHQDREAQQPGLARFKPRI